MDSILEDVRSSVVAGAKAVFRKHLVEAGEGNLSACIPGRKEFFITPTFNDYESLTGNDVVRMSFDGRQLSSGREPSSEFRLHAAVYAKRPRASCVIHTHSPFASMLSVAHKPIPVILEEMLIFLGGSVPVSKYGQANTDALALAAVKALGRGNAILMANHGAMVCGRSMEHAVKMAELVEKMAKVFWGASHMGKPAVIPKASYSLFLKKFESDFATC